MVDNIEITPGSGRTVAADDIAGALHQRVKLSVGGDGEAADLDFGQAGMANSLPVTLASDQSPLPVDAWGLRPNGAQPDQRLTVDATVDGVQFAAFHADTSHVFWSVESAECRVTFDGSAPSAANGHLLSPGERGVWSKPLASAARFIRAGSTSAVIHASQMTLPR